MSSGLSKGRQAGYKCSSRLRSAVGPARYADKMLAREVTVHRKRGCVAERGSPTDSVLLDNHRLRDCCREAEREKKGMRMVLSGTARESRDLVQGEPH